MVDKVLAAARTPVALHVGAFYAFHVHYTCTRLLKCLHVLGGLPPRHNSIQEHNHKQLAELTRTTVLLSPFMYSFL